MNSNLTKNGGAGYRLPTCLQLPMVLGGHRLLLDFRAFLLDWLLMESRQPNVELLAAQNVELVCCVQNPAEFARGKIRMYLFFSKSWVNELVDVMVTVHDKIYAWVHFKVCMKTLL